jgi:tetratricopeptide (TPR) repeat protein
LLQTSDYLEAVQTELTRIVAKLLEGIEQHQAAEEAFRQYVSRSKQAEAVLVLAAFIARRQRIAEALDLCEDAWKTCSPVDVAVVSVGVVRMGGPLAANHVPRVESQLMSAIRSSQPPIWNELMVRLADLNDFQGRHQDAARIYRKILAQDQRNLVALNNLAWLLSFQSENRTEALALINSAIELAGPAAALLDTRAVVSLNMNRVQDALQDLNAALDETQAAAIYIHLAQAQLRANDGVAAKESFQQAKDNGFDSAKLHPLERPDYNRLIRRLNNPLKNGSQTNF